MRTLPFALALTSGIAAAQPTRPVDFARDVAPLLARCVTCHGPQVQQNGLRLDDRESALKGGKTGPVILPGRGAASRLILRVSGAKGLMAMPPTGEKLTPQEVVLLRYWIDQGAKWTSAAKAPGRHPHWAFQPLRRPPVPAGRRPVDAFILARLEKEGLKPSPEAPRSTLLRRLSLDLTGLPPTLDELAQFLADTRPDAYERQVDRLLASPHYGEKWARHWLDLARYADSDGYEKDWARPWAWRYRHWVIDALNRDLPFDQFTIQQIAGDLLPHPTVDERVATGFHRNTLTNREGGVSNEQFRFENTVDRAVTVATVWLGLTMGCAQCHDHKYDPLPQRDFYRFYAFFDSLEEADIDAPLPGELGPWLRKRAEYEDQRRALLVQYRIPELQPEWERQMLEAAAHPGQRTDWDLAWDCLLKLTEGGDGEKILRKAPEARTPREREVLTTHFIRNYHFAVGRKNYDELKFGELDKKLRDLYAAYPQLSQAPTVAEEPAPRRTHLRLRGDYKNLGPEVEPGTPAVLPPLAASGHATRLELARWLVSPENPLTARVVVNRMWQELFGQGLVRTPEDFGTQGARPTHPELLDWLACEFIERGWSMKQMHRLIVTSATYRQTSDTRPELDSKDPANTLLARQSRLRLPAELIRDAALAAAGLLDTRVCGRSVRPPQPPGVAELAYANSVKWAESDGADRYRRGLYIHFQRTTPYPLLVNFDAPKSTVTACRRIRSNTPLQALNLLNDPVFVEAAQALAHRILVEAPPSFEARLARACQLTLARQPEPREIARLRRYYEQQAGLASPNSKALAPWTGVASVLLNLDEFIVRE